MGEGRCGETLVGEQGGLYGGGVRGDNVGDGGC